MATKLHPRILTLHGETHDLAEWSEITGIPYGTPYGTLYSRVRKGETPEEVLSRRDERSKNV